MLERLLGPLLCGWLFLGALLHPAPAWAAAAIEHYCCDGDPLEVRAFDGPVDAVAIPNRESGPSPGAFVVLQWRGLSLQLPRTNNAGPPSYTDGRWWWSPVDPDHPAFRERRGAVQRFSCERQIQSVQLP